MKILTPFNRYRLNPNGTITTISPSRLFLDLFGTRLESTPTFLIPFQRNSKTLTIRTKNVRIPKISQWNIDDKKKCDQRLGAPPFQGGGVDTLWGMDISCVINNQPTINGGTVLGKLVSPRLEIKNDQWVYISEHRGKPYTTVVFSGGPSVVQFPKITNVFRYDGNPDKGESIPVGKRYYCTLKEDVWVAGDALGPRIESPDQIRKATFTAFDNNYYLFPPRVNQPGRFSLKVS